MNFEWELARLCRTVLFASKVRGEYIIPVPDMSNTAAMAARPGWDVVLRGKRFRAGAGVQDQQLRDFADAVAVISNRLEYSTSAPFILRYKAFAARSGERGHPVSGLTYVIKEGKNKGRAYQPDDCERPFGTNLVRGELAGVGEEHG